MSDWQNASGSEDGPVSYEDFDEREEPDERELAKRHAIAKRDGNPPKLKTLPPLVNVLEPRLKTVKLKKPKWY